MKTMTVEELRLEFPPSAILIPSDSEYAKPELSWLEKDFWDWFQKKRWDLGLHNWTRKNDCDNFARAYAQDCADCWALTPGPEVEGLAVGEFFYHSRGGPHAIIVAFTDKGKVFIEPQNGKTITLTPEEEMSCFVVRF